MFTWWGSHNETMAGKTIELYIYRDDANASFGPIVVGTIKVNKNVKYIVDDIKMTK